jgi:hypothetical protein
MSQPRCRSVRAKPREENLDWLPKAAWLKEIEDVAFSIKTIEIRAQYNPSSDIVLLMEDKKPAQESSYDQVKDYMD